MSQDPAYFARRYFELYPGKRRYVAALAAAVAGRVPPGSRVLDLGAGFGFLAAALRERGLLATGAEHSAFAARQALVRAPVVAADAEAPLPYAAGTFAAVTLCDVIEHLADPPAALAECRRVLVPGGWVLVITSNAHSLARPLLGRSWSWHQDPTHRHLFSRRSLSGALAAAGFGEQRVRTVFNFLTVGESTPRLRPLARLGCLVTVPWVGDGLWAWARA